MAPAPVRVPRRYLAARPPSPAPAISVVTPSLEQGRFLERTIRSVVEQGYPALEYVVQDGGSTDETLDVVRRWEDRLAGWESRPDASHAQAVNRGFARTSGEIMAFLNSDDVLLPGALAHVSAHFARHPDVEVVYGHRLTIDEGDRRVDIGPVPRHDDEALRWSDIVPQETLFWRRSLWERTGAGMDETLDFALDWDLLLRFLDAGARMACLDRYLGAFRVHEAQKTVTLADLADAEVARLRRRAYGGAPPADTPPAARAHHRRAARLRRAHRLRELLPARRVAPPWLQIG
jgi:glycosyltransferase involved in cell wall biosynthesis